MGPRVSFVLSLLKASRNPRMIESWGWEGEEAVGGLAPLAPQGVT